MLCHLVVCLLILHYLNLNNMTVVETFEKQNSVILSEIGAQNVKQLNHLITICSMADAFFFDLC